ncbi:DUF4172 domain-containing protein [uncultured Phocaeicola sp.]|uniref:DUF4172 domain-containing protein n=1 Tax=uncultured Phocaeicola sp. TaxID=990718 RepID=UPI0025E38BDB|nr:DUF4172 domain-containing protein [uncultured Phocaeicola sp.]
MRLIIRKTVYLQETVMPIYVHEHKEWPSFSWNKELVGEKLNKVNKAVGYLMERLSVIGFNDKMPTVVESISHDIIASSEIEKVPPDTAKRSGRERYSDTPAGTGS